MEPRTLILSQRGEPHGVVGWQKGIVLLVKEKVDVLETYDALVASNGNAIEQRAPMTLSIPSVDIGRAHV
jgi:hypothetical protein